MLNFLYVLVSGPHDRYANMTALSASFLKDVHPGAKVFVLCNPETETHLRATEHPLLRLCDTLLTRETSQRDAQSQNRYLKSMMREVMKGDFLYLDSDVLVVRPLDHLFHTREPLSLAHNHNREYPKNFLGVDVEYYDRCAWPHPGNGYYLNGGVIFWRDCPEAHVFSRLYREMVESIQAIGLPIRDQPAINRALEVWGGEFGILPDSYNAQVSTNPITGLEASVWHFYESVGPKDKKTHLDEGMEYLEAGRLPDPEFIKRVRSSRIHLTTKDREQEDRLIAILREKGSVRRKELLAITGNLPKLSCANTFCTIVTSNYIPYALNLLAPSGSTTARCISTYSSPTAHGRTSLLPHPTPTPSFTLPRMSRTRVSDTRSCTNTGKTATTRTDGPLNPFSSTTLSMSGDTRR
jgi:hypothetical protein